MLQAIRSKTASIVARGLALLLVVAFAAWGVEDFIGARATEKHVATVGDHDIDPRKFEYELGRETERLRRAFGGQLTDAQLMSLGIGNAVLQRMINDAALEIEAGKIGLLVSDEVVVQAIHRDPAFQGFDGKFSRSRFDEIMRNSGLTEDGYVQQMRASIATNQLLESFGGTGAAPAKVAELLRNFRYARRTAELLAVKTADQPDPGQPAPDALETVYKAQSERFTAPEYRKLSFVHLDPATLVDTIEVDDAMLKATYEANAAEFVKPETRTVQQMVFNDKETADKALAQLKEGRTFEDVAVEVAKMDKEAVNLGTVVREGMLAKLSDITFSLPENGTSEPIETPLGFYIIKVTAIHAGETKTLEDVKDRVRSIAAHEKAIQALYDLSIRFEDSIGGGATLEEAASSVGANVVSVEAVDRQGKMPDGKDATLPPLASLLPVAFSTDESQESPLTEVGDKGYFMVRVDKVTKPALKPLETVLAEVTDAWRQQQKEKAAEAKAKALAERASSGTPMADLGKEISAEVETVGPLSRMEHNKIDGTVAKQMFAAPVRKADIARVGDGFRVIFVTGEQGPAEGTPAAADIAKELDKEVGNDIGQQMMLTLRRDFGVKVNERVYNEVVKPGTYDPNRPG